MSASRLVSISCACSWSEERGCVRVTKVDPEHTCLGVALPVRSVASRQRLLQVVPQLLLVEKSTKPVEIQNDICIKYNTQIDYQAAHKVKYALLRYIFFWSLLYAFPPKGALGYEAEEKIH